MRKPRFPDNWDKRQHRFAALCRAFVRFNCDIKKGIDSVLSDMTPEKRAEVLERDPWFSRDFSMLTADQVLEEGLFLRMVERSMTDGNQGLKANHTLLMAMNKERYNPSVQAAGKLTEGIVEGFKALASKPMSPQQIVQILVHDQKVTPIAEMKAIEAPTLDEAIEMAKVDGTYVVNDHIREDRDLAIDNE